MFLFLGEQNMRKKYLNVAYEDRDLAKRLGARWDPSVKKWYCTAGSPLAKIFTWRQEAKGAVTPASSPTRETTNSSQRDMPDYPSLPPQVRNGNLELPLLG